MHDRGPPAGASRRRNLRPVGSVRAKTNAPRVAVFDAGYPSTLALVQSLGRRGVPMVAYHHRPRSPLAYSRYIDRVRSCPDVHDHARFGAWLAKRLESGAFDLIAPTSDAICFHIAEIHDRIDPALRRRLPSRDALLDVLFKDRLAAACERSGVATPATVAPTCVEEALAAAERIGYPVIVKPRTHVFDIAQRGGKADNADELRALFRRERPCHDLRAVLETFPGADLPVIQEYISHERPQIACSGLLAVDQPLIAGAAVVKLDQAPAATGTGTAFASHDAADLVAECGDTVQRLLGTGLFEIEVLDRGDDGPPLVIDVNARVFGQINFDIARGNDLPALWYDSLTGGVDVQPPPAPGVCLYPAPFVLSNLTRIVTGPTRWRWFKRSLSLSWRTRSCIGWDSRDPLASVIMSLSPLRHPTTFIRSHIRQPLPAGAERRA